MASVDLEIAPPSVENAACPAPVAPADQIEVRSRMAKRKQPALFDVIHATHTSKASPLGRSPFWSMFQRIANPVRGVGASISELGAGHAHAREQIVVPASEPLPAPIVTGSMKEVSHDPPAARVPGIDVGAAHASGVELKLEPERYRFTLRATYTSGIIAVFAVIVLITLSYLIGSRTGRPPMPALASQSTEQLRNGPTRGSVLEVSSPAVMETSKAAIARNLPPKIIQPTPTPTVASTENAERVIGRNYIVVQLTKDAGEAKQTLETLAKAGVAANIEKGVVGYAPKDWLCIVTRTGFDRMASNPEYEKVMNDIANASKNRPAKARALQPKVAQWKGR